MAIIRITLIAKDSFQAEHSLIMPILNQVFNHITKTGKCFKLPELPRRGDFISFKTLYGQLQELADIGIYVFDNHLDFEGEVTKVTHYLGGSHPTEITLILGDPYETYTLD